MKTVGLMAVYNFPYAHLMAERLCQMVDEVYLRFDVRGDREVWELVKEACGDKLKHTEETGETWTWWSFREGLLRMLDGAAPDLVLFPDEDEVFEYALNDELPSFMASDKRGMMFRYHSSMPTDDSSIVEDGLSYPIGPLMKVFKWQPGLTYLPYHGWTRVTNYADASMHWPAQAQVIHYALWTQALRESRRMNR